MNKVLKFEGAGWDSAEHNGVGNCRIRATFKNMDGVAIYLEISASAISKWAGERLKHYNFPFVINHLFLKKDEKENYSPVFDPLLRYIDEYTKENLLKFINEKLGCDYDEIQVINDRSYYGFDCQ